MQHIIINTEVKIKFFCISLKKSPTFIKHRTKNQYNLICINIENIFKDTSFHKYNVILKETIFYAVCFNKILDIFRK